MFVRVITWAHHVTRAAQLALQRGFYHVIGTIEEFFSHVRGRHCVLLSLIASKLLVKHAGSCQLCANFELALCRDEDRAAHYVITKTLLLCR